MVDWDLIEYIVEAAFNGYADSAGYEVDIRRPLGRGLLERANIDSRSLWATFIEGGFDVESVELSDLDVLGVSGREGASAVYTVETSEGAFTVRVDYLIEADLEGRGDGGVDVVLAIEPVEVALEEGEGDWERLKSVLESFEEDIGDVSVDVRVTLGEPFWKARGYDVLFTVSEELRRMLGDAGIEVSETRLASARLTRASGVPVVAEYVYWVETSGGRLKVVARYWVVVSYAGRFKVDVEMELANVEARFTGGR